LIVREIYAQGAADLKFAGIKTPGLDASLLLAHVLKTTRTALVAAGTDEVSDDVCEQFCDLIVRRCEGECVAYITGKKEFRGLEFEVNPSVLVPRPDTEILVETAIDILKKKPQSSQSSQSFTEKEICCELETLCNSVSSVVINILELCTGSGAVAIALKHEMPEIEIHATDICAEALETAKRNAEKLLSKNMVDFYHGDLFDAIPKPNLCVSASQREKYSIVVSNPPYIPSCEIETLSAEVQNEPRIALDGGNDGLDVIRRIINGAPDYLEQGGTLLLEADPRQMNDITNLLEKRGFIDIQLYKDLSDSQRVIGGRYEK